MNLLENLHASDALHVLSQGLIVPTVVVLLALAAYVAYTLGALVVEAVTERRRYRACLPQLIDELDAAAFPELGHVIDQSGLLDFQRAALHELLRHAHLPEDARTEVARRLLAGEADRYERALAWTDSAAKIAPMLGLMGTLIPLGPGVVGLGSGDLATLSASLLVAFDTTVAGLLVAVVCYLVTRLRRRWYRGYLGDIESALNVLLEKCSVSGPDTGRDAQASWNQGQPGAPWAGTFAGQGEGVSHDRA